MSLQARRDIDRRALFFELWLVIGYPGAGAERTTGH